MAAEKTAAAKGTAADASSHHVVCKAISAEVAFCLPACRVLISRLRPLLGQLRTIPSSLAIMHNLFFPVRRALIGAALIAFGNTSTPADAQVNADRHRFALRAGAALAGTGDEVNCTYAPSLVGGAEARTRGRWFLALSGDIHLAVPFACADVGTLVPYGEDQWAYQDGGAFFALAPRVGLRAGVAPVGPEGWFEPTVGGGLVLSTELSGGRTSPQPWASGAVAMRLPNPRWAVRAEHGIHGVTIRHELHRHEAGHEVYLETRQRRRWEPLFQLALQRSF